MKIIEKIKNIFDKDERPAFVKKFKKYYVLELEGLAKQWYLMDNSDDTLQFLINKIPFTINDNNKNIYGTLYLVPIEGNTVPILDYGSHYKDEDILEKISKIYSFSDYATFINRKVYRNNLDKIKEKIFAAQGTINFLNKQVNPDKELVHGVISSLVHDIYHLSTHKKTGNTKHDTMKKDLMGRKGESEWK